MTIGVPSRPNSSRNCFSNHFFQEVAMAAGKLTVIRNVGGRSAIWRRLKNFGLRWSSIFPGISSLSLLCRKSFSSSSESLVEAAEYDFWANFNRTGRFLEVLAETKTTGINHIWGK